MHQRSWVLVRAAIAVAVTAVVADDPSAQSELRSSCVSDADLSIVSRQNASGHWETKVRLEHPLGAEAEGRGGAAQLQLQRSTRTAAGGARAVALQATLAGCVQQASRVAEGPSGSKPDQSPPCPDERPVSQPVECPKEPPSCPVCPTCPTSRNIPKGYVHHAGLGYYKFHITPLTAIEAQATCEREGGNLIIINSKEEANIVVPFFAKYSIPGNHHGIRVGIHDLVNHGVWYTVLGEPLAETGFAEWSPNEPNKVGNNEHCGSLFPNGRLNDIPCDWRQTFVCEL